MEKAVTRLHYGHLIVILCFIVLLFIFGIHYTFGLYLKPILAEFGWSRTVVSGAYSISWLIQGPSSLILGKLNDRIGPRFVLSISCILICSGIFLTSMISAGWQLYISYGVLIGIGTGGIYVPIVSTIARWFDDKRSAMTGFAISGMGLGTFLISPVAAYLIINYSWRTSYRLLGVILLVSVIPAVQFLKPGKSSSRIPANTNPGASHSNDTSDYTSLGQAMAELEFWKLFGMFFCFGFCLMAVMVHVAPYALDTGLSPAVAAGLVSMIGISSIVGKIILGGLGDVVGNKRIYIFSYILMGITMILPISASGVILLYIFATIFGLAYGGMASSQSPLAANIFGLKAHGEILGAVNIGFTTGSAVGPVMAGLLFDHFQNYQSSFKVIELIAITGLALSLSIKGGKSRKNTAQSTARH